jgi:hypothetical protein
MKSLFKISTILFLCGIVTVANAQKKVWSIGPEIGVTLSKYGMDANTNHHTTGLAGGLFLTYSVINTFGITGKILYAEKGADLGAQEIIMKYIEIPLTGRFFLNKEGKLRPNIFIGPSFGFLRGVSSQTGTSDPVKVADYQQTYNDFDLGVTGGLGLNYQILPETRLLFDARYTYGLSDITKAAGQINNETVTLTFGMSFGI